MKAKIFYGPAESGKTMVAKMIAEFTHHPLFLDGKKYTYKKMQKKVERLYYSKDKEIDLIIIDDIPNGFNIESLFSLITEGVTIDFNVKIFPKIIITTNYKPKRIGEGSFDARFECIEFPLVKCVWIS